MISTIIIGLIGSLLLQEESGVRRNICAFAKDKLKALFYWDEVIGIKHRLCYRKSHVKYSLYPILHDWQNHQNYQYKFPHQTNNSPQQQLEKRKLIELAMIILNFSNVECYIGAKEATINKITTNNETN